MHRRIACLLLLAGCATGGKDDSTAAPEAPVVILVSPLLGATFSSLDSVPLELQLQDGDDALSSLTVAVLSDVQGLVANPQPDASGKVVADLSLVEGVHNLSIVVTDPGLAKGVAETTVRVWTGSQPSQPALRIEPVYAVTGDQLSAVRLVDSVDPEGDPLVYTYAWTVDGQDAGITGTLVDGGPVSDGQVWQVSLVASDQVSSSPTALATITIGNGAPDPGTVVVAPATPVPGDDLSCRFSANPPEDPEGDAVTLSYAWTLDGVDLGLDSETISSTGFPRGGEVSCAVIAADGSNAIPVWSRIVQMGNTPPLTTGAIVDPPEAVAGVSLRCLGQAFDPDGDPLSFGYRWTVNGIQMSDTDRLDSSNFVKGDEVICEATASDAWVAGSPAQSDVLVVGNTAPGAPVVGFRRSDLVPGGLASCAVEVAPVDVDGDVLAYVWSWEVNGQLDSETTANRSTEDLATGDVLTCVAVADDGTDQGPAASASITLGEPTLGALSVSDALVRIQGPSAGADFGQTVDGVGDVDGDGVGDLLVTAPNSDGANAGSAWLFSGAMLSAGGDFTTSDAAASWVGDDPADRLGAERGGSEAGDVDGDGRVDLLISAPGDDGGGTDSGTAYLLYGGSRWGSGQTISSDANARFRGALGDGLGTDMAATDLDGDGLSDVIFSAPGNDDGASAAGELVVYYGTYGRFAGTYDAINADALVTGTVANTQLGGSLSAVGDPNGDGYPDLGAAMIYDDTNGVDAGTVVLLSGARMVGTTTWVRSSYLVIHGLNAGDRFGSDLSGPGDLDQDGVDDLLVGGSTSDGVGADAGEVRLFFGVNGINREVDADFASVVFAGDMASANTGASIERVGDFDDDGLVDVAVGSPGTTSDGLSQRGSVALYLGRSLPDWLAGDVAADVWVAGAGAQDRLGAELGGNLDLQGDAYSDMAVGAPDATVSGQQSGGVYIFVGP